MSKMDALRAMREAKYAANSASGPTRREAAAAAAGGAPLAPRQASPAARPRASATTRTDAVAAPNGERCGHKSMNGRACTRDAGHSEKSHRYS